MKHLSSLHHSAIVVLTLACSFMTACNHDSLEDKAEKDAKTFNERYCPTPTKNNQRTDSVTFDRDTRTFNYYFDLSGASDNQEVIDTMRTQLREALVKDLKEDMGTQAYKEAGFSYHYVFYSASTHKIMFEALLQEKDYK